MVLFGNQPTASSNLFGSPLSTASTMSTAPANRDIEVPQAPDDTVQALKFGPAALGQQTFLASGSWDNKVRVWEVTQQGTVQPKSEQNLPAPVLEIDWFDDGTKIFIACADKTVKVWDLQSNQLNNFAQHDQPVKTCNWIKGTNYSCLMTGSWDKNLMFWDPKSSGGPIGTKTFPERIFCADVVYPMAAIATADRQIHILKLEPQPDVVKQIDSPLKFQSKCMSIFKDKVTGHPAGFALGSIEGRVAIQYVETVNPKDNFTFKCHRSPELVNGFQDIYAVNDVCFHPNFGTLATVGSDGKFSFWDKDNRTKLRTSEAYKDPITRCCINHSGEAFAFAVGYDWSKGHAYYNPQSKPQIFIRPCAEEMKPKPKK